VDLYYYFDKSTKRKSELAGIYMLAIVLKEKFNLPLHLLSEFSDFCDVTYGKIVHHISVRWLSLQAAVDRALKQYPALCSMFLSKGMHALVL